MVLSCATLGPIGRIRKAPGTWGSVAGLFYQILVFHPLSLTTAGNITLVILLAIGIWFAIALCGEAEFRLGRRDPGEVVLDEFVAMPLCFLGWPMMAVGPVQKWPVFIFVLGFGLFRLFDITKPLGIKKLQDLPGGWGVVIDDLAAALLTCGVLHGAAALWRMYWHG
ncbi:MAG TPA: phosphatidylglycerophosphatase A [Opitutaceae bacterium]|nr:phosphatidylglycerophosphatase A [Opitutaceae bacterium]